MARKKMPRGRLTASEALATGKASSDGFTTRTTGTGVGRPARNALSTGFAPEEGREAEVALDPSQGSPAVQVMKFNIANRDILGTPGASMGQGGWLDPSDSMVKQDASVLTPRSRGGMDAAMQIASQGGQEAIGNLGRTGYEGDIPLPPDLRRGNAFAKGVWHETGGIDPRVTQTTRVVKGERVPVTRIIPSRKEMAGVEAARLSESMPETDQFTRPAVGAEEYLANNANSKRNKK